MTDFLTVAQVASRWNLSGQSIRRKITKGAIPAIKAPGSRAIRIPAAFVADHEGAFSRASTTPSITTTTTI